MSNKSAANLRSEKERTKGQKLKPVELRLVSELMQNCRRSDRELAKTIGVSQPTVSRLTAKLQKEGYFQEFALIPRFNKLGFRIMAIIFFKLKKTLNQEETEKARKTATENLTKHYFEIVMVERGMGLGYNGVVISYHKDYSSYVQLMKWFKQFDFLEIESLDSFIIDLEDKIYYRSLTFKTLAQNLLSEGMKELAKGAKR
jgi:DNA-binding Lrp family transcriptional regulator